MPFLTILWFTRKRWLHNTSQSHSCVTTHDQLATLPWCQTTVWGPWPDFYYCQTGVSLLMRAPSLIRGRVFSFICCWTSRAKSFSGPSPAGLTTIIYCIRFEATQSLEGQVPVFISLRNRVVQLYILALGSPFMASYRPQGYGGDILIFKSDQGEATKWTSTSPFWLTCYVATCKQRGTRGNTRSSLLHTGNRNRKLCS
jgi:hypothetical protein